MHSDAPAKVMLLFTTGVFYIPKMTVFRLCGFFPASTLRLQEKTDPLSHVIGGRVPPGIERSSSKITDFLSEHGVVLPLLEVGLSELAFQVGVEWF